MSEEEKLDIPFVPEGTSPGARVIASAIYALAREVRALRKTADGVEHRLHEIGHTMGYMVQ